MRIAGLLIFAITCCANAFASDAYYLIKDGRLQNGAVYEPTENDPEFNEGDGYATLKHNVPHAAVKLTGMKGLHIGTKNLILEYAVDPRNLYGEEESVIEYDPIIMVNCVSSEKSKFNMASWEIINPDDPSKPTTAETHMTSINYIDGKGKGCDIEWNKYDGFTYPRNNDEVKAVFVSYMDEYEQFPPSDGILKIKNLYFETKEETCPIYSCQFDGIDTWTEVQYMDEYIYYTVKRKDPSDSTGTTKLKDEEGRDITDTLDLRKQYFQDGLALTSDAEHLFYEISYKKEVPFTGYVTKYPVSEIRSSLSILKGTSSVFFKEIPLSENVVKTGKIKVSCIAKVNPRLSKEEEEGANTSPIPIYLKFDNSEEEIVAFRDTALLYYWGRTSGEIDVPAGAKNVTVEFRSKPQISYLVDNFMISYDASKGTAIASVTNDEKTLCLYPNPVYNEISFADIEDIQSVEIAPLNGAVKAYKVVNNKVNVSNLAAGEYVIIVNKNISGKFIKK